MSDIIDNIEYEHIKQPSLLTGMLFAKNKYTYDSDGNLMQPDPIVNAVDINWGGAKLHGLDNLDTTSQLLKYISDIHRTGGGSGSQEIIDKDSVVDVMLSAIRALQTEVVKLRNSLVYGVYSYTGKQTAMSEVINDYGVEDINAEEPLWAVDETHLSELISVDLSSATNFDHVENIKLNTENSSLTFIGKSTWRDSQNLISNNTDPKLLVYLTTNGLKVTFNLIDIENNENTLSIKLNELVNSNENNLYNILFILATSTEYKKNNNTILAGDNFCWIQVGHFIYDGIQQGYYNNTTNTLQDEEITFGNRRYILDSIDFDDLTLSKFNVYSKYQDFSNEVEAINPNENDRYRVAHITIRSMATLTDLMEIKDQLPENELIYVESDNTLYIKNEYKIKKLGLGSGEEVPIDPDNPQPEDPGTDIETMTNKELIETLKKMGIIYEHYSENATSHDYDLELAALSSVTFIHEATGRKFDISVDAYGKLKSEEQSVESLKNQLDLITANQSVSINIPSYTGPNNTGVGFDIRAFGGKLNFALAKLEGDPDFQATYESKATADFKLNTDRLRIGAIYAPKTTDKIYGCSHGYIELENTSDRDFYLDGCRIYYTDNDTKTYHLDLKGIVPANGTYLIRCKQFADAKSSKNVFISVDTYDIEWWIDGDNGPELLDTSRDVSKVIAYAIVHLDDTLTDLTKDTKLYLSVAAGSTLLSQLQNKINADIKANKLAYCYDPHLIDAITLSNSASSNWSANNFKTEVSNCIYKNTFELDPAKQAYNAFNMYESSRVRWNKPGTDSQYLNLDKEYIEFPKSNEIKYVKDYTPKASFEHKNVCTDKTQLDSEKPNMPTVSFGVDIFRTRCFNWISCGLHDEYVFLKYITKKVNGATVEEPWVEGSTDTVIWKKFESYKSITGDIAPSNDYPRRYEYKSSEIADGFSASELTNAAYARFTFNLPANGSQITSHKCIVELGNDSFSVDEPLTYTYVVGRMTKEETPDFDHCSDELTFTVYPKNYTPRIYQITDQQGFHWIEYQVWSGAAIEVNKKIEADKATEHNRTYTQEEVDEYNATLENAVKPGDEKIGTTETYNETTAKEYNATLEGAVTTENNKIIEDEKDAISYNSTLNKALFAKIIKTPATYYEEGDTDIPEGKNVGDEKTPVVYYSLEEAFELDRLMTTNNVKTPATYYKEGDTDIPEGKHVGDIKTETVYYTVQGIIDNDYNVAGAVKVGGTLPYSKPEIKQHNDTLDGHVSKGEIKKYTAKEANAFNAKLPGAVKVGDEKGKVTETYDADQVNEYNAILPGAVKIGDLLRFTQEQATEYNTGRTNGTVEVGYVDPNETRTYTTQEQVNAYNATLPGAVSVGQTYEISEKYTEPEANTYNATLQYAVSAGQNKPIYYTQEEIDVAQEGDKAYDKTIYDPKPGEYEKYTEDEAFNYNQTLTGAWVVGKFKKFSQEEADSYNSKLAEAVSVGDKLRYTKETANTYNAGLTGAVNTSTIKCYGIIPILINTGDAVQAGCRINEWLDYYNGGKCLFDHLEQMEIVGNNDLCSTDYTQLGTGDDEGKSNSFFYSLFYCYQIDPQIPTLIRGLDNTVRYIPSLYYFDYKGANNKKLRFVNVNSEITYINARDWFKLNISNHYAINPYNGYTLGDSKSYNTHLYCIDGANYTVNENGESVSIPKVKMVSIYEMIYRMINGHLRKEEDPIKYILACHEMPFTVITHANMNKSKANEYRSNNGNSLVGSHLNQLTGYEYGEGTYWFSRLLEYKGIRLCIGGHKHTYCYTYPLREYYKYTDNGTTKNSFDNGPMPMKKTLKTDNIVWTSSINGVTYNTSKLPIAKRTSVSMENLNYLISKFYPELFVPVTVANQDDNNNFVTYFMCQATGYKLTSNKELPTPIQAFTQVLPETKPGTDSDTPNANQKFPMFAIIAFDLDANLIHLKNIRVSELYKRGQKYSNGVYDPYSDTFNFNQQSYSTKKITLQYLVDVDYYNKLYWKDNDGYGDSQFGKIDAYNKEAKGPKTKTEKIEFNNYGVWTSQETEIDEPMTI